MAIHADRSDQLLTMELTLGPAELWIVRRIACAQIRSWGFVGRGDRTLPEAEDVLTVVNELLTNVLDHVPDARCTLNLECQGRTVHIRVGDGSPDLPVRREPGESETAGRGLALVDALTHRRWKVAPTAVGGKEIHCRIDVPQEPEAEPQRCQGCSEIKVQYYRAADTGNRDMAETWITAMGRHQREAH